MDKQQIVTEGVVWLMKWLEQSDPDFKGASIILITTTNPTHSNTAVFDMASNESSFNTMSMLLHGLTQTMEQEGRIHYIDPTERPA